MNLEIINNLVKNKNFIQKFIKETIGKENNQLQDKNNNVNNYREQDCLYQVIDRGENGIFLQNTKNNVVFEEKEIPEEIKDIIENDYILRYKDGKYIIEEEITDDFFNNEIGIKEYQEIKNDFIQKSDISKIDPDTRFYIVSRQKDYTILSYESSEKKQIEVPNVLLPYFIYDDTVLYYKDGKFEKD